MGLNCCCGQNQAWGAAWFGQSRSWSRNHFIFSSGAGAL